MAKQGMELDEMARQMRLLSIKMAYNAGKSGAHLGGGLSCVEILAAIYGNVANIAVTDEERINSDRVFMGKGHGVLAYYSALYLAGLIDNSDIESFEENGSSFIGHPKRNTKKAIDFSSGSLGLALPVAVGSALAKKRKKQNGRVLVILGDGECQEGSIWESLIVASKYRLDNLTVIVDNNQLQSDGFVEEISGIRDFASMFQAFGLKTTEVDGHDVNAIVNALKTENDGRPNAVIAHTVKGKGVSFMENERGWHHGVLSQDLYNTAKMEIEGNAR